MRRALVLLLVACILAPTAASAGTRRRVYRDRQAAPVSPKPTPPQTTVLADITASGEQGDSNEGIDAEAFVIQIESATICAGGSSSLPIPEPVRTTEQYVAGVSEDDEGNPVTVYGTDAVETLSYRCGDTVLSTTVCLNPCAGRHRPWRPPPSVNVVTMALWRQLRFKVPKPEFSPPLTRAGASAAVGLPLFWAIPASQWTSLRLDSVACALTSCVRAWVSADPVALVFRPGEGSGDPATQTSEIATCTRVGPAYVGAIVRSEADYNAVEDGDCLHVYQRAGRYNAAVLIQYAVNRGRSNGETFPQSYQYSRRDVVITAKEFQAVIIK